MRIDLQLLSLDLTAQIELIRQQQVTIDELVTEQNKLFDLVQPKLNCFIEYKADLGQPHTQTKDNVLLGLPIAVKDNIDVLGFNTTAGLAHRRNIKADSDAFVISQLRQAGASFNGKLNMHEAALGATNQNPHFGDCHNPYQLGYTPGGSSGGSATAVAAGLTSAALGTDTMGSVRIPAAYCGVFGFKASHGLVSNRGSIPCSRIMDHIGPITRSVRDIRLLMNIMGKFDPYCPNAKLVNFLPLKEKYRLLVPSDLDSFGIEPSIIDQFNQQLSLFESMGHDLHYFDFSPTTAPYDFAAARRAGLIICEAEILAENQHAWQLQRDEFSPYLASMLAFVENKSAKDIINAERALDKAKVKAAQIFSQGDLLLMPTSPQRAFPFDAQIPSNQADLTSFANQAQLAAISLPMIDKRYLPSGFQIIGPAGADDQIIELAEKWQTLSQFTFELPQTIKNLVTG